MAVDHAQRRRPRDPVRLDPDESDPFELEDVARSGPRELGLAEAGRMVSFETEQVDRERSLAAHPLEPRELAVLSACEDRTNGPSGGRLRGHQPDVDQVLQADLLPGVGGEVAPGQVERGARRYRPLSELGA